MKENLRFNIDLTIIIEGNAFGNPVAHFRSGMLFFYQNIHRNYFNFQEVLSSFTNKKVKKRTMEFLH